MRFAGAVARFTRSGHICSPQNLEARGGIEPPIKVLQTFALPLGDRASEANLFYQMVPCIVFQRYCPDFDLSPTIDLGGCRIGGPTIRSDNQGLLNGAFRP